MLRLAVVAVHEAHEIFLVERADIYALFVVKIVYEIGVLDDHHPFRMAIVYQVFRQSPLVFACELILRIGGELAVIRRIKKDEVILLRVSLMQELFEVKVVYFGIGKVPKVMMRPSQLRQK